MINDFLPAYLAKHHARIRERKDMWKVSRSRGDEMTLDDKLKEIAYCGDKHHRNPDNDIVSAPDYPAFSKVCGECTKRLTVARQAAKLARLDDAEWLEKEANESISVTRVAILREMAAELRQRAEAQNDN